jgi:hypothetical protein
MQERQQFFAREKAIRHDPHEKWGNECRDRGRPVRETDLLIGEPQRLAEVGAHRDEPDPPDEILEEHHRRQPRPHRRHFSSLMRMSRRLRTPSWSP